MTQIGLLLCDDFYCLKEVEAYHADLYIHICQAILLGQGHFLACRRIHVYIHTELCDCFGRLGISIYTQGSNLLSIYPMSCHNYSYTQHKPTHNYIQWYFEIWYSLPQRFFIYCESRFIRFISFLITSYSSPLFFSFTFIGCHLLKISFSLPSPMFNSPELFNLLSSILSSLTWISTTLTFAFVNYHPSRSHLHPHCLLNLHNASTVLSRQLLLSMLQK